MVFLALVVFLSGGSGRTMGLADAQPTNGIVICATSFNNKARNAFPLTRVSLDVIDY
jgi:hypothetical protein